MRTRDQTRDSRAAEPAGKQRKKFRPPKALLCFPDIFYLFLQHTEEERRKEMSSTLQMVCFLCESLNNIHTTTIVP